MSAATATKPDPIGPLVVNIPHHECPACDSAIPRENVHQAIINPRGLTPTRQRVQAVCLQCARAWEVFCELRGGAWVPVTPPDELDGARRTRAIERIEAKHGVVRRRPVAC